GLSRAQASETAQAASTATAGAALATAVAQSEATVNAAPTATAEALAELMRGAHVVYAAHVPGPGCDSGGAEWVASSGAHGTCLREGLRLTSGAGRHDIAIASCLHLPAGGFPRHYLLSVVVRNMQPGAGADVVAIGSSTSSSNYDFNVDQESFYIYDLHGQPVA